MLRRVHVHVCSMNVHKNVIFIGFDGKASSTTNELKIKKINLILTRFVFANNCIACKFWVVTFEPKVRMGSVLPVFSIV